MNKNGIALYIEKTYDKYRNYAYQEGDLYYRTDQSFDKIYSYFNWVDTIRLWSRYS